jgi:hypothetical protein
VSMVCHYLCIGEGATRISDHARWWMGDRELVHFSEFELDGYRAVRGYVPYTEHETSEAWAWFRTPKETERYLARMEAKKREIETGTSLARDYYQLSAEEYDTRSVEQIVGFLDSKGIEAIFTLLPTDRSTDFAYRWREAGVIPNLWAYDDPSRYWDEFYAPDRRYDSGHLGNEATHLVGKMIGERIFREIIVQDPGPS